MSGEVASSETVIIVKGEKGEKGDNGIGFKLTANCTTFLCPQPTIQRIFD